MRALFVFRACVLSFALALGLVFSTTAAAWTAHHNGNYYHGNGYHGGYNGYHGNYYGGYHGYGYRGYGYGGWGAYPVYGCRSIQTCYMNGSCVVQRVCP